MTEVPFSKYSGCGNDFILIDHRQPFWPFEQKQLVPSLCARHRGIGADGVILLEDSMQAHFKMRIFNADGSEAEMCGNGIRCLFKFIHQLGLGSGQHTIESLAGIHALSQSEESWVQVDMGEPKEEQLSLSIAVNECPLTVHYVNTGVPHTVIFVDDISDDRHMQMAPHIRYHKQFPNGTNVNFVQMSSDRGIVVRTYERGVEAETLACGTGLTAVGYVVHRLHKIPVPIQVHTYAGDCMRIDLANQAGKWQAHMTGPAHLVFEGTFNLNNFLEAVPVK